MTLHQVFRAGSAFLRIVSLAILIYCILSWFQPRSQAFVWLGSFIRPFVAPFRRLSVWLMHRTRIPLDFSCWFAILGIELVNSLWWFLYRLLANVR